MGTITQKRLVEIVKNAGQLSEDQRNGLTCSLIGHSGIQTFCFGYFNCGRCGVQVGDSLGSSYSKAGEIVVIGHDCDVCKKNYAKMTWRDKLYVENPFSGEGE